MPYITPKIFSWIIKRRGGAARGAGVPINVLRGVFQDNLTRYNEFKQIHTDGSKSELGVGAAVVLGRMVRRQSPPLVASIYTAELYAISMALDIIAEPLSINMLYSRTY